MGNIDTVHLESAEIQTSDRQIAGTLKKAKNIAEAEHWARHRPAHFPPSSPAVDTCLSLTGEEALPKRLKTNAFKYVPSSQSPRRPISESVHHGRGFRSLRFRIQWPPGR